MMGRPRSRHPAPARPQYSRLRHAQMLAVSAVATVSYAIVHAFRDEYIDKSLLENLGTDESETPVGKKEHIQSHLH